MYNALENIAMNNCYVGWDGCDYSILEDDFISMMITYFIPKLLSIYIILFICGCNIEELQTIKIPLLSKDGNLRLHIYKWVLSTDALYAPLLPTLVEEDKNFIRLLLLKQINNLKLVDIPAK
jgi:hypothetical protein